MAETIQLRPIKTATLEVRIVGTSPLITHRFDEKAKRMMREKHAGKKTKNREVRCPEKEAEAAAYKLTDGSDGIPATGIKNAMASAAHKDLGIPKTVLRRGLFIKADDTPPGEHPLVRIESDEPEMREDVVRVGMGSTDLRYRPEYRNWSISLVIEYDEDWLTPDTILSLLERAGFGVGLCEWRPERDGDFGRFCVDREGVVVTTQEEAAA